MSIVAVVSQLADTLIATFNTISLSLSLSLFTFLVFTVFLIYCYLTFWDMGTIIGRGEEPIRAKGSQSKAIN